MRKIVMIAALLAAAAMAPQPAEAGDRGSGFRHFPPHAGARFHRPHHGLKFDHRGFVGKHRQFEPRHFHRFVARHRQFEPRHAHRFGHGGLVLKFGTGDFVAGFGDVPRFGQKRRHGGSLFRFDRPRHFGQLRHRGFARQHRHDLAQRTGHFGHGFQRSKDDHIRGLHGAVPPEALLRQLEHLGFRHVPELLRERSR